MVKSPFIAHFRGGGRNHLLLSLLDNLRRLGCYTVRPLCRPEKGHRDLTSLSIVAVRAGWWVLKLVSLHPQPRVGKLRQPRKQQVTMGLSVEQLEKPPQKDSSPSGGGSWHEVPDGRGNCKARGTVVFCPGHYPTRAGTPPPLHAPSVALRRQLPPNGRSLMELPVPKETPTPRLLPPAGEEAGRRSLTDGRGICKARGTVVFCPGHYPTRAGTPPPLQAPSVALRRQLPPEEGAFCWLSPMKTANKKASSPSGGGSWQA